jgi:hypothetical protein
MTALLAVLTWASLAPAQEQGSSEDYLEIPGTRVSLRRLQGFSLSPNFPGLLRQDAGSFVVVNQIPGAFEDVKAQLNKEVQAPEDGVKLLGTEDLQVSGMDAFLVQLSQTDGTEEVRKSILLFGNDSFTVMLAASVPQAWESELGEGLRQTLLTAQYFPDRKVDPYYGLGFSMRESTVLEVRAHLPGGILMTRKGAPTELTPEDPVLVVYPTQNAEVAPLEIFAMQQLTDTEQFTDFANFDEHPVTINGMAGYEIIADAKVAEGNIPVRIFLLALRSSSREIVLQGVVATGAWEQYLPEFRGLAESFQLDEEHSH